MAIDGSLAGCKGSIAILNLNLETLIMRSRIPFGPSSIAIGSQRPYGDLNSVFQSFFNDYPTPRRPRQAPLLADFRETEDAYLLQAELPGVKRGEIELQVLEDALTLSGSFGPPCVEGEQDGKQASSALRRGAFERRFDLPGPVDASAIQATHVDGLLTVTLPKAVSAHPTRIEVQGERPIS